MSSIFNKITKNDLIEYLKVCSIYSNIDLEKSYDLAIYAIKYYKGNVLVRENLRILHELEAKWYKSLENNSPDYSVYNDSSFLSDIWACWIVYSRKYLLNINSKKYLSDKSIIEDMGDIKTIIDLGCGFGYTTAGLKELFPKADVFGTNIENSCQFKIATEYSKLYNFYIIPDIKDKKADLIFASEYFEHIEKPVQHLIDIINICNPKYFIIANSFNTKALGHFNSYNINKLYLDGKTTSREFNNTLRIYGYKKIDTKLWNNRPTYWKKS